MSASRLIGVALAASLTGGCIHRPVSDGHLFQPGPCAAGAAWPESTGGFALETDTVRTQDGATLETIALVHPAPRATLLYFGGNSLRQCPATLASEAGRTFLAQLHDLRVSAMLVNYRGYGASTGQPSFERGRDDAVALFDRLAAADPGPVLLLGQSLGSVFATHVALARPVRGLVLESAPTTIADVLDAATPWYAELFVRFDISPALEQVDHRAMVRGLELPVLLVTGGADRMTPPRMERALAQAIGPDASLVIVPGGSHGDLVLHAGFWTAVTEYVDRQLRSNSLTTSSGIGVATPATE